MGIPRRSVATLSAGTYEKSRHNVETRFASPSQSNLFEYQTTDVKFHVPASAPIRRSKMNYSYKPFLQSQESANTLVSEDVLPPVEATRKGTKKSTVKSSSLSMMSSNEYVYQEHSSLTRSDIRTTVELSVAKKKQINTQELNMEEVVRSVKKVPKPNYHENDEEEQLDVTAYLIPCDICGRKFMEDRLVILFNKDKHKEVCYKTKTKQRKVFDVQAARVAGTEMEKYVKNIGKAEPIPVN